MLRRMPKTIRAPLSAKGRSNFGGSKRPLKSPTMQTMISMVGVLLVVSLLWTVWDRDQPMSLVGESLAHRQPPNQQQQQENHPIDNIRSDLVSNPYHFQTVQSVRDEFYHRYGGADKADAIFAKGIESYGSVQATARRILNAAANNSPFILSFAGYSVTVGRGNYYSQSFPFVVGRILEPLLRELFHLDVVVRNSAIGGIPSYPYAFCFEHFLGRDPHVISWDFSMNEGKGAAVLESYLRQSQHQLPQRPMIILLDTNRQRCSLLERYASPELSLIQDALCVAMAKDVVDERAILAIPNEQRPPGFQFWEEFGAPNSCPGRGSWHPKKMEHELMGWMIAMYFVHAVEVAQKLISNDPDWRSRFRLLATPDATKPVTFPKPLAKPPTNNEHVSDLLFGHVQNDGTYIMKPVSCRTNFLPATDVDKVLPSIVVSGLAPGITADNIMDERTDDAYQTGWVLDVSKVERDTKIKVEKCGGLGYVDLKTALYGIPESGTLRLWLPSDNASHRQHEHTDDLVATHWFDELVVCEANEKRKANACHLDSDLEFIVGGVPVKDPSMINGAAEYLQRQTCVHVGIPLDSKVTPLGSVTSPDGTAISLDVRQRLVGSRNWSDDHVGLLVDIRVKAGVTRQNGACCVSHVVWEEN